MKKKRKKKSLQKPICRNIKRTTLGILPEKFTLHYIQGRSGMLANLK
jgi:hypothetical protein